MSWGDEWSGPYGARGRDGYRVFNVVGRISLAAAGDDSQGVQTHQSVGYQGGAADSEVRDRAQRFQTFGLASLPLPGAKGVAVYQWGHRGWPTIVADEDPRYRPTGQQPGEVTLYMVDGAAGDGSAGTLRRLVRGLLGWVHEITGKTISIGSSTDTTTLTITCGGTLNITGNVGDVVVNGISLVNHVHPDAQGGLTGAPQ